MRAILVVLVALSCAALAAAECSCDPPHILWYNIVNSTVSVDKGLVPATIEFTVDDDVDLLHCEFDVWHANDKNTFRGCVRTNRLREGKYVYESTANIAAGMGASVDWIMTDLYSEDIYHNGFELQDNNGVTSIPHGAYKMTVLSSQESTGPALVAWGMPLTVDVTTQSQTIVIPFQVQVGVSGLASAVVDYDNDKKPYSLTVIASTDTGLVKIDDTHYSIAYTFERGMYPGVYRLHDMMSVISDNALHNTPITAKTFTDLGVSLNVTVKSVQDDEAPKLVKFDIFPRFIDTTHASAVVTFRAQFTDNYRFQQLHIQGKRSNFADDQTPDSVDLKPSVNCAPDVVCTDTAVTLQWRLEIAAHTPTATWSIPDDPTGYSFVFSDYAKNIVRLRPGAIAALGFPTGFDIKCDGCGVGNGGSNTERTVMWIFIVATAILAGALIWVTMRKRAANPAINSTEGAYSHMTA